MIREHSTGSEARAAGLPRHEFLALAPAFALAGFWFGIEGALVFVAAGLPLLWLARRGSRAPSSPPERTVDAVTGLPLQGTVLNALDLAFRGEAANGKSTACLVVGFDEPERIREAFGLEAEEKVLRKAAERLRGVLRDQDVICRIGGQRFGIALAPGRRVDLEAAIELAGRLKSAVAEPFSIDAAAVHASVSLGFCLSGRAPERTGQSLLEAAEVAFAEAARNGPGAVRAFTAEIGRAAAARDTLQDQIEAALENGEIVAYFQPQLSTDTGDTSGFEALARWQHPERGVLVPAEFLPAILQAGLGERLGEVTLNHALSALRRWDTERLGIPGVALNFSREELRDPALAAKLQWQLDRFDLPPHRLTIEILESVAADTENDVIVRNIAALSRLGCPVDLDDFGTGHASIAAIRRFAVNRIKIDRSYVTQVDSDPSQRRMVAAVLSMAERLGLQTLAEGVETIAEHAMLAQLGCTHVQGFVIARPMPVEATADWIAKHRAKLGGTPDVSRKTG